MWDYCGMERTEEGLRKAIARIRELKAEFWSDVKVLGHRRGAQPGPRAGRPGGRLHRAGRADVHRRAGPARILRWALPRRVADRGRRGAAPRRRVRATSSAWEFGGEGGKPILHKEPLVFEYVELKQRSYK